VGNAETSIAPYVAALLVRFAEDHDTGLSARRDDVHELPSGFYQLDVAGDIVDEAIRILERCGIASVSRDRFAGDFVAIKQNSFRHFIDHVERELAEYHRIVRESPDEHDGLNRAEAMSYPSLDLLNQYKPMKSYNEFGRPWLDAVLNRLKSEDPTRALSENLPIDSAHWTGIEKRISAETVASILERVTPLRATIEQSDLSDRDKKNAIGRVDAIEKLLSTPDPPWKTIVELLNSPILTAFLNVTAILALIFGR
jgi:hypothetical protein